MFAFVGAVYLLYYALIEKSITWTDFSLLDKDWELLQIGLVLFFLQVGKRKMENLMKMFNKSALCLQSLHLNQKRNTLGHDDV